MSSTGATTLQVNQAGTSVSWSTPAAITYGTALTSTQLDASATPVSAGTFVYNPAAGTVLNGGSQTLSVQFTPTNANYALSIGSATLQVSQASQSVKFTLQLRASDLRQRFHGCGNGYFGIDRCIHQFRTLHQRGRHLYDGQHGREL